MADDNTTPDTSSTDTSDQGSQDQMGTFAIAVRRIRPDASDQEVAQLAKDMKANPDKAPALFEAFVSQADPQHLASLAPPQAIAQAQANQDAANTPPAPDQSLQTVTITGKKLPGTDPQNVNTNVPNLTPLQMQLPSSYAGTTQEAANPQNPQAAGMSQFDPAALQAAQAAYNARQAQNQNQRGIAMTLGSLASGWDQGRGMDQQRLNSDQQDLEAYKQTIGQQIQLQNQATAGQQAATSQQNQNQTAGNYIATQNTNALNQQTGLMNAIGQSFGAQTVQRMNDPASPETQILKQVITANAASLPPAGKQALAKILSDNPDATAVNLLPVVAQYAPAIQNLYLNALKGNQTQAETANLQAQTPGLQAKSAISQWAAGQVGAGGGGQPSTTAPTSAPAGSNPNQIPAEQQRAADVESLKILQAEATPGNPNYPKNPGDLAALQREIMRTKMRIGSPDGMGTYGPATSSTSTPAATPPVQVAPMTVNGIDSSGNVSIGPKPGYLEQQAQRAAIKQNWETTVGPAVNNALDSLDQGVTTGVLAKPAAVWLRDSGKQQLITKLAQIENTSPGTLPPGLTNMMLRDPSGKSGFTGQLDPSMSVGALRNLLLQYADGVQKTINYDPTAPSKPVVDVAGRQIVTMKSPTTGRTGPVKQADVDRLKQMGYTVVGGQ